MTRFISSFALLLVSALNDREPDREDCLDDSMLDDRYGLPRVIHAAPNKISLLCSYTHENKLAMKFLRSRAFHVFGRGADTRLPSEEAFPRGFG